MPGCSQGRVCHLNISSSIPGLAEMFPRAERALPFFRQEGKWVMNPDLF